jgi:SAM-dependent methyltransferase
VLAAGVIYCFTDHQEIIRQLCRISSESVVVESNYPQSIRDGNIQNSGLAVTEYTFQQEVNLSDSNESLLGLGATSSINAFDIMFRLNSFSKQEHKLDFPVSEHTVIYNSPMHDAVGIPFRFAVRYVRNDTSTKTKTLEQCLPEKHSLRKNWLQDTDHISRTNKYKQAADKRISNDNKWEFNEEVASRFLEIARREIPDYDRVIEKTIEVAHKAGDKSIKVIDVGSATGYTLQRLHDAGFSNLYGVDNSQDMLNKSFAQARLICSDEFPVNEGPFDLVIANWVLHFIPEREQYLKSIRSSLSGQGVLVLTEKTMQSNSAQSLYYDFKRGNGVSEQEIQEKQQRLEGVLTAYPLTWYYSTLASLGFNQIDILNANHGFVTIMAKVSDKKES